MLKLAAFAVACLLFFPPPQSPVEPIVFSGVEFPQDDLTLVMNIRQGLSAKTAARQIAADPGSPLTVRLLAQAKDRDGLLVALRYIVEKHPDRIAGAFEAMREGASDFRGNEAAALQRAETFKQIVADARKRLPELPREEAARAERVFITLDGELNRGARQDWRARLATFIAEYQGTEAAQLAEVDLISSRGVSQRMFDELDALMQKWPHSTVAAKALYTKGFHWHTINTLGTLERRGADPTNRFMRVLEIVKELESGRYPASEWVAKVPSLLTGFFYPRDGEIAPENIETHIRIYEELAAREFNRATEPLHPDYPASSGVGYIVTSKLRDLYAQKGDRTTGVERLLATLERSAADASAVRYLRGLFYMQRQDRQSEEEWVALTEKAAKELEALSRAGAGLYHRKALATLGNLQLRRGEYADAAASYKRYAQAYPQSDFAWVAVLRAGLCDEQLGHTKSAAALYLQATSQHGDQPIARVLGHEYAARALEVEGALERALGEHERALAAWDNAFGLRYSTHAPRPSSRNPFELPPDGGEVRKESLPPRIIELKRALSIPGGTQLERGRALLARERFDEAATVLDDVPVQHPTSPAASDARALAHLARFRHALELADAERTGGDEAAALKTFEALSREPTDFGVTAARIARAAMLWKRGESAGAEQAMSQALTAWHARQRITPPANAFEADVVAIRRAVFLPRGGKIYGEGRWNAFSWPASLPPFLLVKSDLPVKQHDGGIVRVSLVQEFPVEAKVVFFDSSQVAVLEETITRLGGTKRREPGHVMETPNQPIGDSMQILKLWSRFFSARPGHWGGWELETYPVITEIQFADAQRSKASVRVTIGYSGATVELEKENGQWVPKRLTGQWIT